MRLRRREKSQRAGQNQTPIGCQTVFSSRKRGDLPRALRRRRAADDALDVLGREPLELRRVAVGAARRRSRSRPCAPASHGASSARWPVRMLTTPPGTSEVASTSASSIAASGCVSEATTTTALPPTIAGASRETRPSERRLVRREDRRRRRSAPGTVKLKYGPATGFDAAEHLRELVGPARVPDHAVDRALDLRRAAARARANSARRASIISAIR